MKRENLPFSVQRCMGVLSIQDQYIYIYIHYIYIYILFRAFTMNVRPLVEYCCSVWSPYQCTLIHKLESIQRIFTKKLFRLEHLTHIDRLRDLNADTLEIRRPEADLIFYYKIFHKLVDLKRLTFFRS